MLGFIVFVFGTFSFWEMLLFKVLRKILSLISGVFCVLKCLVPAFFSAVFTKEMTQGL